MYIADVVYDIEDRNCVNEADWFKCVFVALFTMYKNTKIIGMKYGIMDPFLFFLFEASQKIIYAMLITVKSITAVEYKALYLSSVSPKIDIADMYIACKQSVIVRIKSIIS